MARAVTSQSVATSFALDPVDGEWVVFAGHFTYAEASYGDDLWLASVKSGQLSRLTKDKTSIRRPMWSPDGTQIVFQRAEEGIWTLDLNDGRIEQVYPGESGRYDFDTAILGGRAQ